MVQCIKDLNLTAPELMVDVWDRVIFMNVVTVEETPTKALEKVDLCVTTFKEDRKLCDVGAIGNQYFRYFKLAEKEITLSGHSTTGLKIE